MIEALLTVNPELYNFLMEQLIKITKDVERKYNSAPDSYAFRFFKPDDPGIGCARNMWDHLYSNLTEEHLFAQANYLTVPARNAYVYLGWYCDIPFKSGNSYLKFTKFNVTRSMLQAKDVYNQQNPKHMYIDLQHIGYFLENDMVDFVVYNDEGGDDVRGRVHPLLYRVASRPALNLESYVDSAIGHNHMINPKFSNSKVIQSQPQHTYEMPSELMQLVRELKRQKTPMKYVEIQNTVEESHLEPRMMLDPDHEEWLKTLQGGEVCPFCGYRVYRNHQKHCYNCGIKTTEMFDDIEIEEEVKEDNKRLINLFKRNK